MWTVTGEESAPVMVVVWPLDLKPVMRAWRLVRRPPAEGFWKFEGLVGECVVRRGSRA